MSMNSLPVTSKDGDMLISVIVPVYNVAPYLDECLESICSQTYGKLEVVLIDDGSKDDSGKICDLWREKDPRIHVLHKQNAGVSSARNDGLELCTGDLITFVDSDDWLELDMLEGLVRCLRENDADAVMCGFVDYPHGAPVKKGLFTVSACDYTGAVFQMIRRNGYFTSLWAKMFRRELVFRKGKPARFDPTLAFGEDEVWLLKVLQGCKRTAFLPRALYYWRPREGSVTRSATLTDKQMSIFDAKAQSLSLLPDEESIRTIARGRIYNDCFSLKVQAYCTGDKSTLARIQKELRPMWRDWIHSRELTFLRKCKVLLLDSEMLLHLPAVLVNNTNELTH